VKALSIRQPWAWAILHAGKRIENRDWRSCHYRGPLLIHAAKGCTRQEYDDAVCDMAKHGLIYTTGIHGGDPRAPLIPWLTGATNDWTGPLERNLYRGGIVGVCNLVGVIDRNGHTFGAQGVDIDRRWFSGPIGLVLADIRPLPFVPLKGALGFFDVPDHLVPSAVRP
jgi:hypothetical protein